MTQPILTPDRRLRVFVSSTLRELAVERAAAREAISSLRLAPVMFEQGARPHAPRDVYAAYVGQCDVFVGVYWQSYGWIAPGASISGLEDELELGQGMPMLLYVKEPAPEREERLSVLIRRIEDAAGSAYRPFATTRELRTLITDDLALLLTERFQATAEVPAERSALPARITSFVGRNDELAELVRLMERSDVRLVTLTGPGGIGKTRLALEAASRLDSSYRDGAAYVPLDRLTHPDLMPGAIAEALGLTSLRPDQEAGLARWLRDRELLLVLDNFEHVLDGAPLVTRLLETASRLEVIATSREPLRLQGENEFGVPPLADAVPLFMERVEAVRPDVVWDDENVGAASEICRRVDALPLAVELVAAGARMLSPRALLEHLGSSLDTPAPGRRDAPARQQTIRATIDWSYGLLDDLERDLFERLGAFDGSFTIEAARSVSSDAGSIAFTTLSALVDKSLLGHAASESETRFRMLQIVSEYAAERLGDRPDAAAVRAAHADFYVELARAAYTGLRSREQRGWKDVLDRERENVMRALGLLSSTGRLDEAAEVVWAIWPYWLTGAFVEGRKAAEEVMGAPGPISERARARVLTIGGILAVLLAQLTTAQTELGEALTSLRTSDDDEGRAAVLLGHALATAPFDPLEARTLMIESAELFGSLGDDWEEALALGMLGWLDTGLGDFSNGEVFERGHALATGVDDDMVTGHTATNLAEFRLAQGRTDDACQALVTALNAREALGVYDGLSYSLEAVARLASASRRPDEAVRLLGAADRLRDEVGVPIWGARLERFEKLVDTVRDELPHDAFSSAWGEGQALDFDAALELGRRTLRDQGGAERS